MKSLPNTILGTALTRLLFTKTLALVLISNLFTLIVCNTLKTPVWWLLVIYPACLLAGSRLVFQASAKRTTLCISWGMISWLAGFWLLLSFLRVPYLLEWLPGNIVQVQWDDTQRISGLISMTMSDSFPLRHFANQDYYYSYYYASMIPFAVMKLALPFITLKDAICVGNALYYPLIFGSLLEIVNLLTPNRRSLWIMVFLFTAFGGLDWLADSVFLKAPLVNHHDGWQGALFLHGNAQISSFFSALFWTMPHVLGFYATVLAFIFLSKTSYVHKTTKALVVGLLLIAGFYSSVFAFFAVPLFCAIEYRLIINRFLNIRVLPILIITLLLPIQLFLNRPHGMGFIPASFHLAFTDSFFLNKLLSLPVWFLLVTLVEFCFIPVVLFFLFPRFSNKDRKYFVAALLCFLSTYIIAYTNYNNYSMRGMFLPTFVFYVLFSKYVPRCQLINELCNTRINRVAVVLPICFIFSIGTIFEFWAHARIAFGCMSLSYSIRGKDPRPLFPVNYRELARNHAMKFYVPPLDTHFMNIYNAEKMIHGVHLQKMLTGEIEQLRYK